MTYCECATQDLNRMLPMELLRFFALLYQIDRRNKAAERNAISRDAVVDTKMSEQTHGFMEKGPEIAEPQKRNTYENVQSL